MIVTIRAVAGYQLMSDMTGEDYIAAMFGDKQELHEGYQLLGVYKGIWGLQYCVFTFDFEMDGGLSHDQAQAYAETLGNQIISDSDIEIHWVGPASQPTERE